MIGIAAVQALLLLSPSRVSAQVPPDSAMTCYVDAMKEFRYDRTFSASDASLLCFWAKSSKPLECYKNASPYLSSADRALLCSGAETLAPLDCYDAPPNFAITQHGKALLCSGATPKRVAAPSECYDSVGRRLDNETTALLCSGATSNAPADCFDASSQLLPSWNAVLQCSPRERMCRSRQPGNRNHCTSVSY